MYETLLTNEECARALDEGGFFSQDDGDDTIALSNDELNNIMNTAEINQVDSVVMPEEQPEENSGYTAENPEFEHEKEDGLRAAFDENITGNENKKDLSTPPVWSFVLTLFLCSIPVVGLIHLIVLAFGGTKYEAKKNYARAVFLYMFIMAVVSSAITVILIFFFGDSVADYLRYFTEIAGNF